MTFPHTRLKHVAEIRASNVDKKSVVGHVPVRLCNYMDVYKNRVISESLPFMNATATRAQVDHFSLRSGDVLITKDSERPDDIGVPAYVPNELGDVVCGYHLSMIRADSRRLDPRYLAWVLQSEPVRHYFTGRASGVTRFALGYSEIGDTPIPTPSLREQGAVVRSLDEETSKIQVLVQTKRLLQKTIQEWEQASLIELVGDWRNVSTKSLRQLRTKVVTGPFGTQLGASEYVVGGIPLINPTHILDGGLVPEPNITVNSDVALRLSRHRLNSGDVIMGRKGDVGRAALVETSAVGWICGSDSIAIRTDGTRLLAGFLATLLRIKLYRQQLEARSTGATIANVNESILLNMRVPAVPVERQEAVVAGAIKVLQLSNDLQLKMKTQIALLNEEKAALITAAVTGQIDVGEAA